MRGAVAARHNAPALGFLLVGTVLAVGVTLQFRGILALVAGGVCALLLLVTVILTHRTRSAAPLPPAALTVAALVLTLLFSVALNLRSASPEDAAFSYYGQTKQLTLPAVLVMFGIFALAVLTRSGRPRVLLPAWWTVLAGALVLSTVASVLVPRQAINLNDAAQALALLIGALMLSWLGFQAGRWSPGQESALLLVLLLGGLASGLLATRLVPFGSLLIPGTFAALLLAFTHPRHRVLFLVTGAVLGVLMVLQLVDLNDTTPGGLSIAVAGEAVGCVLLVLLYLLPRILRPLSTVVAVVGGGVALVRTHLVQLLTGQWQGFDDVTLAHRGYETHQVLDLLLHSPVSWLVGLGPAATVDLTASPDAGTLAASGRVLSTVDDVHLLSSYLLLKLGLAGLVWAVLLGAALVRLVSSLVRDHGAWWDRAVLMFVVAGVVSSLPAATNLFTNPLVFLLLG